MRKLKIVLLIFVIAFAYACSNEETIENTDEFNLEKTYFEIINSENPKEEYSNYSNNEKSKLWEYKYKLFISRSEKLTDYQILLINTLKDIAVKSIKDEEINESDMDLLQSELMNNFEDNQYFDLLYFLDNPSLTTNNGLLSKACFWCTMYETTSPCYYDSHGDPVQNATFYSCRFWSCHEVASTGTVPCQEGNLVLSESD